MLLSYCLNDFEMISLSPVVAGVTFVFYIPYGLYFCCKVFIFLNLFAFLLDHIIIIIIIIIIIMIIIVVIIIIIIIALCMHRFG